MIQDERNNDTIAALATAPGKSGIAIVRISGPASLVSAGAIFSRPHKLQSNPRVMLYGHIVNDNAVIDESLVCYMPGPHSYTGEDVVEIHCHGGNASAREILSLLEHNGVRSALPGEFTRRAFLNGRIDLVQAEAVMEIISAHNSEHLKYAERLMDGAFSKRIESILDTITHSLSLLDLNIEFLHQGIEGIHSAELVESISAIVTELSFMIDSYTSAKRITEGVTVVFAGEVNTGKSSLFNAILGRPRAIVNIRPGTTRDWLEESITLDSIPITLYDTAGFRETDDDIEQEGLVHSRRLVETADIVIVVEDATVNKQHESHAKHYSPNTSYIFVKNKVDLAHDAPQPENYLSVSAKNGTGIDQLKAAIRDRSSQLTAVDSPDSVVLIERHRKELALAREALERAISATTTFSEEIASLEIKEAQTHIESILGRTIDIDTLDTIFSTFCIGK